MASWMIFVSNDDVGNWPIAQTHGLWDMTTHFKVHQGDLLYFFQTGAHLFLGQGMATSDATPLPVGTRTPWQDREPRRYTWRFTFDVISAAPRTQPDGWGSLVSRLDQKGAPQSPREYLSENDERVLASFFPALDAGDAGIAWSADEDRRRILEEAGLEPRRITYAAIRTRQRQARFRRRLIDAYEGRCAVTGSRALSVLEAAHIHPYGGPQTNKLMNGLLLRADIHTLFDLHRLTIVCSGRSTYECFVAPDLRETEYGEYHHKPLAILPGQENRRPDRILLGRHNSRCSWLAS